MVLGEDEKYVDIVKKSEVRSTTNLQQTEHFTN